MALHKCRCSRSEIVILLKSLRINHLFLFRTVKGYSETGDIVEKPKESRLHSVCPLNAIHTVCEHVRQNLLWKQKLMAMEMSVSTRNMSLFYEGRSRSKVAYTKKYIRNNVKNPEKLQKIQERIIYFST